MSESDLPEYRISSFEASDWWRRTNPTGALLNKLMLLFIVVPIALVVKKLYALSFLVFALMIPYGLFLRHLAVRAARRHLQTHPEDREQFEQVGIISC
jgi:hypothetical protein